MNDTESVKQVERRLREEYAALFPGHLGWEKAALYCLLAFEFFVRQNRSTDDLDCLKYPLMHILRWGRTAPSKPMASIPSQIDAGAFDECWELIRRGNEYTGLFGQFRMFENGIVALESVSDQEIRFKCNPEWLLFNELDSWVEENVLPQVPSDLSKAAFQRVVDNIFAFYTDFRYYLPNVADFRNALPEANLFVGLGCELPDTWAFDDIPIATFRSIWAAFWLLAMVHVAVSSRQLGSANPHPHLLMARQKDRLSKWLADCLGIEVALIARILGLHTYDRQHSLPDIALTPFLPINRDVLAFSPWLLIGSRWERNLQAFAARQHKKAYDKASHVLAPAMASGLTSVFRAAGMMAEESVPIHTARGDTDIDILVWSPQEQRVLAAELKWIIAVADVMEVVNRGEKMCMEAIHQKQIPKYREALAQGAGRLVQQAFSLPETPEVMHWECALIVKGFVGTPRVICEECLFIPQPLAEAKLRMGCSLQEFCEWAKAMPYLDEVRASFQVNTYTDKTPSGFTFTRWERK